MTTTSTYIQGKQQWTENRTPDKTYAHCDFAPLTTTLCCLLHRNESIYTKVFPLMPYPWSLHFRSSSLATAFKNSNIGLQHLYRVKIVICERWLNGHSLYKIDSKERCYPLNTYQKNCPNDVVFLLLFFSFFIIWNR